MELSKREINLFEVVINFIKKEKENFVLWDHETYISHIIYLINWFSNSCMHAREEGYVQKLKRNISNNIFFLKKKKEKYTHNIPNLFWHY